MDDAAPFGDELRQAPAGVSGTGRGQRCKADIPAGKQSFIVAFEALEGFCTVEADRMDRRIVCQ